VAGKKEKNVNIQHVVLLQQGVKIRAKVKLGVKPLNLNYDSILKK
jgi:hypothetical protein